MAKITMSEALARLPENTANLLHAILKQNLSDDFLVDLDNQKIHINFPEPQVFVDVVANGAVIDPESFVLTINKSDGSNFSVSLAELAKSAIQNEATSAVELSGNGSKTDPLKADVKISQKEGNQLSKDENGALFVSVQPKESKCLTLRDVFGQPLGENGEDIKVVLCSQSLEQNDPLEGVSYIYHNSFSEPFVEIKNFLSRDVDVVFKRVGDLSGNALKRTTHSVIEQSDGKYTHRFTLNSGSFSGEQTAKLVATINGIEVDKTLTRTGSTNDGGYIYEG